MPTTPSINRAYAWAKAHDGKSVIAYEGIRKWKRGAATARADYRTVRGNIVQGSFASTHFRNEMPPDREVFEEASGQRDAVRTYLGVQSSPSAGKLARGGGRTHRWRTCRQRLSVFLCEPS